MVRIAETSQRLVTEFVTHQAAAGIGMGDPLNVSGAFIEAMSRMMADPGRVVQAQMQLWQDYMTLWQHTAQRMMGQPADPVVQPAPGDRRFRHHEWQENVAFDFIKQSYLLTARWLQATVKEVEGLDEQTARKVDFYTREFVDAMAPTNFVMTNPQVLEATLESNGENLVHGLENMLRDLDKESGQLHIRMTDPNAFKVGIDVARTPGQVVFRNELMELIQYEPMTETVHRRPLLVVPPWINKFYILDLRPENSFIRWANAQGFTTFVISWVNPDEKLAKRSFEDYMLEGMVAAMDAIEQATGEREIVTASLCLGGTLTAATLAWLAAKGDDRVKAATYMNTLVDFEEAGDLSVFIDEEQIKALEDRMAAHGGVLDADAMATTFNMLRANDLIWSFVINNYLLGKDPFPFDLLFWNSDSTRMPSAMHSFYLRNMYQKNLLSKPGGIPLGGESIDLGKIKTPSYVLAAREDHIAPWKSSYVATQLYGGPVRFVLTGSGHIAGVTNSPEAGKYPHWLNPRRPKDPEAWLKGAKQHDGSWWINWEKWCASHAGPKVPARQPGDGKLKPIEPAPGRYVKVRAK
ncbi:MAG: class I poly(R)-hydroxyalkanoic acid synthase [Rhodospirillaceae bacterium]|nr:class I poly(R)-hydroxyalkanoic acid synthase [Rhodospirillaceae bacterium]